MTVNISSMRALTQGDFMIESVDAPFEGLECVQLKNDLITIWLTKDVGPRILGLKYKDGENLLAVLPDLKIPVEGADDYSLRGGHRLWYAPEKPETSYIADDQPLEISPFNNGINVIQNVDRPTGIQKSWQVAMAENEAQLTIVHKLTNRGDKEFELAPWAITQLRPGGTAVLPLQIEQDDEHGLLPNRQIVFWPYTELNSPHLLLGDKGVVVKADLSEGALKVGAPNPIGWLAYELDGFLFIKRADYQADARYLDRGASSQIYCSGDFIELETLGPVVKLAPGESVEHQEIWQVFPEDDWPLETKGIFQKF